MKSGLIHVNPSLPQIFVKSEDSSGHCWGGLNCQDDFTSRSTGKKHVADRTEGLNHRKIGIYIIRNNSKADLSQDIEIFYLFPDHGILCEGGGFPVEASEVNS